MKKFLKKISFMMALLMLSHYSSAVSRTAFVHLYEWQWNDIASECENFLGPKGFSAVQVSPPQKSIGGSQWWTRYQPVSYSIEGRSGDRAQFADMVNRCKAVGVDIYVDAVINHMAAWDRSFPEVPYGPNDFHNCTSDIDYSNAWSIQNCDLVGLNDLKTESDYVQGKIAEYMNDLIGLGVAGFRIDAAKHMPAGDINAIKNRLSKNVYIFQEVIDAGSEPVRKSHYTWVGDVIEFNFANTMGHYFKLRAPLSEIGQIDRGWDGWLGSGDAVVFVSNHDNQRQKTNDIITHKDGNNANNMAHVFMLGWPYGYPKVMSSYDWNDHDQGPPGHGASSCSGGWLCEHRSRPVANMVAFRNNTAAHWGVTHDWFNGNQMAWGRGGLGFVVINMEGFGLDRSFQTGMAAGEYCDIIHADFDYDNGTCDGPTITVDGNGNTPFNVSFRNASAIHVGAKVGVPCPDCGGNASGSTTGGGSGGGTGGGSGNVDVLFTCYDGHTYQGQSVYVAGNHPTLGDWDLDRAYKLNADNYPTWNATINLPANYNVEWKCVKREENNSGAGVEWQQGPNNTFNTSSNTTPWAGFSGGGGQGGNSGRVDVTFTCYNGHTYSGQSVYVVGNLDELGGWSESSARKLDPVSYPTWNGTLNLPQNTDVEWKCLKREENNAGAGVEWQGGANNTFNTGSSNSNPWAGF